MKRTQKQSIEILKNVKVSVLSFEKGFRYSTYGGVDPITALKEVASQTKQGRHVLILPYPELARTWEMTKNEDGKLRGRIPYEVALEMAITLNF